MNASNITLAIAISYVQHVLFILALASPTFRTRPRCVMAVVAVSAALASWFSRGWLGELSIGTALWSVLVLRAVHRSASKTELQLTHIPELNMPKPLAWGLVLIGGFMYAGELLIAPWDAYVLGYYWPFSVAVATLILVVWRWVSPLWAWVWLVGAGLWVLGFRHSPNLWDMLMDVPLWVIACVTLIRSLTHRVSPQ